MNIKAIAGNVGYAFGAQGISMMLSVVISLVVPKFIGIESYGYLQLFLFYSSYSVFFHLGLNDGLYLRFGGCKFEDFINDKTAGQFYLSAICLSIIGFAIAGIGFLTTDDPDRLFVIVAFSIYLVLYDLNNMLGAIFQASNRIGNYAFSVTVEKIIAAACIAAVLFFGDRAVAPLIIAFVLGKMVSLAYCVWVARKLFAAKSASLRTACYEALANIKVGVKLTIANSAGLMVTGIARIVIDGFAGVELFGQVSLALSLTNFFLAFISQVGMVLFPSLRREEKSVLLKFYRKTRIGIAAFFPIILLCYAPVVAILQLWLPEYEMAFICLGIVMPVCYFDGKTNMLLNTYLKVYRREAVLLVVNIAAVLLSGISTLVAVYVLHSLYAVFVFILASVVLRSVALELLVSKMLSIRMTHQVVIEILLAALFVIANTLCSTIVAFQVLCVLSIGYYLLDKNNYRSLFKSFFRGAKSSS